MAGIYFFLVGLAALFGNNKARKLVKGQAATLKQADQNGIRDIHPAGSRLCWFHAASVGEFEQARPIIERLRKEQPQVRILLTFFSPSGYEMRKNYDKVDGVYYLPFATRRKAKRFLDLVRPDMAIFVKYEFWPAYLKELHKRDIPTYSISSIFRSGQLFFRPWGKAYLRLLRYFTHIYVQDEPSRELLMKSGISNVSVAGDTRFDRVSEIAAAGKDIKQAEDFIHGKVTYTPDGEVEERQPVIVAGSTWPPDEKLLAQYMEEHTDVKLILVPHELTDKHLAYIFQLFQGRYVRFTEVTNGNVNTCRVMVVDTMGLLSSLYRYATVAYIGGGFGVGIHNTLEAAVYGLPVLFGPNYHKFREAKGLIAEGAAWSVNNYKELRDRLDNAIAQHRLAGEKAEEYVKREKGATEKIYNELFANS